MTFILALDQGTSSSRAVVFDHKGQMRSVAHREFAQHFPQPGWVEHDSEDLWATQIASAVEAIQRADLKPMDIAAIGITNQRETTLLWDRATGKAVMPAIVWQDRRTAPACRALIAAGHEALITQKTGLVVDAYFSATKLVWMLNESPDAATLRGRAERGELAFGTVDSWLIYRLTGGKVHVTDVSNASRTMLLNLHTLEWDDELLALFDIPSAILPEVVSSSGIVGTTAPDVLNASIPIAGIAGDQQAALFGQAAFASGTTKCTYGTGCFLLTNTGSTPVRSAHRLLSTVAWRLGERGGHRVAYALEGSVFIGGAVVQWLRDGLKIIRAAPEIEALAASEPDNGGVYFVPAFTGLGAPHWDAEARGTIVGLTRGSTSGHLARAALESIAFQVADVVDAMAADSPMNIAELRVDGGASDNDALMALQADICQLPVRRAGIRETTALGAAYLAGLGVGVWSSLDELAALTQVNQQWMPGDLLTQSHTQSHTQWRKEWQRAVKTALAWSRSES